MPGALGVARACEASTGSPSTSSSPSSGAVAAREDLHRACSCRRRSRRRARGPRRARRSKVDVARRRPCPRSASSPPRARAAGCPCRRPGRLLPRGARGHARPLPAVVGSDAKIRRLVLVPDRAVSCGLLPSCAATMPRVTDREARRFAPERHDAILRRLDERGQRSYRGARRRGSASRSTRCGATCSSSRPPGSSRRVHGGAVRPAPGKRRFADRLVHEDTGGKAVVARSRPGRAARPGGGDRRRDDHARARALSSRPTSRPPSSRRAPTSRSRCASPRRRGDVLGGRLDRDSQTLIGADTVAQIQTLRPDVLHRRRVLDRPRVRAHDARARGGAGHAGHARALAAGRRARHRRKLGRPRPTSSSERGRHARHATRSRHEALGVALVTRRAAGVEVDTAREPHARHARGLRRLHPQRLRVRELGLAHPAGPRRLELSPRSLGLVLLAMAVGSVISMPLAGVVVARLGDGAHDHRAWRCIAAAGLATAAVGTRIGVRAGGDRPVPARRSATAPGTWP